MRAQQINSVLVVLGLIICLILFPGCPPTEPPEEPDWIFQSGDFAVYAVSGWDADGEVDGEDSWTEYQWEVDTVTREAVVLRETYIDYFESENEFETMSYLSDWNRNDRQFLAHRFDGVEPHGFEYDVFGLHWIPADVAVGETVRVGDLGLAVAGMTTVMVGADDTTLEAWELVYEDQDVLASFFYDTERGMWLAAEWSVTVEDVEFTESFVLIGTNVPLQGRSIAGAKRSTQSPDVRSTSAEMAKADGGNALTLSPPYLQSNTYEGSFSGWGEMITSEVTAEDLSGRIDLELLGVAKASRRLRTQTKPKGEVQDEIWIPCAGVYDVEIRGHVEFVYGIDAFDPTPFMDMLPTGRARFNANVGYELQRLGNPSHEERKPIIDNELITNLHGFDFYIPLAGHEPPEESPISRKATDKGLGAIGRTVNRWVTISGPVHFSDPGTYSVLPFAEAGLNIGRGPLLSRTEAAIQGAFTVDSITVRWPHGMPPVLHAGGPDWTGPPETGEGCLELDVSIVAALEALDATGEPEVTTMSANHLATVPLFRRPESHPKSANMDMTYYEGEAVFEVSDVVTVYEATEEGCDTVITPRPGIISVGVEVWEDDVRLHLSAPKTPGINVYMDCPGIDPIEISLDTWGLFVHNYLPEMMIGQGISGFELRPQPWDPDDEWIAKLEEVRDERVGEVRHFTDVEIHLRW